MMPITIGRSSQCDIILSDASISRVHAEIYLNNGQYIYADKSSNGSNIGGQIIINKKVVIAPGTLVLLSNRIPLPWDKVYSLLSTSSYRVNEVQTVKRVNQQIAGGQPNLQLESYEDKINEVYLPYKADKLEIGWGILAFIIPIAGWIMYFAWKDETPNRAGIAGLIGTVAFVINIIALCI